MGPNVAGKILEHSQRSLENVQKTVDKATHEIHQTINEKLSDLKTLEKKLSKSNLLEHDANNNDVEKTSKGMSRHSTKLDLKAGSSTQSTTQNTTGTSDLTQGKNNNNKNTSSTTSQMMDKDKSKNVMNISATQEDDAIMTADDVSMSRALQHQTSDLSNESNSSTR
jgi:hypothetical protein